MMKVRKRIISALLAGVMALSLVLSPALAASFNPVVDTITSTSDSRISSMVNAIGQQSFSSPTADRVESLISYFILNSKYAAVGGAAWPYTNENGYVSTVTDGTYTISGINGSGCFAYSKFVMNVVYGKTGDVLYEGESAGAVTASGLATFLRTYAQAGEQIRLGNIHSVTFISCTSDGFYYMDYWGGYIKLHYTTFAKFASACNSSTSSVKLCIYNANTNVNDPSKQNGGTSDPSTGTTSTLTITPTNYPAGQLLAGNYCNLKGTITSNYSITSIKGVLYSSAGVAVQTQTASPYSTSVNIQSSALNKLSFGKLAVGEYYLEYTATDKSGKTVVWTSDFFSVVSSFSTLTISPGSYPTGSLKAASFTLTGSVTSNYELNTVIGSIYSANGTALYTAMVSNIGSTSFSIANSGIDNSLPFGKLTEGSYYLVYEANDKSGNSASWTSPVFTIIVENPEPADATGTFADVSASAWYFSPIEELVQAGIVNGVQVSANKYYFYPNNNLTRAQAVVMFYRFYCWNHEAPAISGFHTFVDVPSGSWYEYAVSWAYENGLINGMTESTFCPEESITRQQMAKIIYYYGVKFSGAGAASADYLAAYTDGAAVADWARESVNWCIEMGIYSSVSLTEKTFEPNSPATRAQCAKLFSNMLHTIS